MQPNALSFRDRADAGRQLVPYLMSYAAQNPVGPGVAARRRASGL
jgi:predicted phosphoribosyltransferase